MLELLKFHSSLSSFRKLVDIFKSDLGSNYLDKLPPILKQNLEKNLCVCNEVPKMDIISAIINGAATNLSKIGKISSHCLRQFFVKVFTHE